MKDNATKERFIQLRAEGLSFEKIAQELKVSKQCLINWCKEFKVEIANLKSIELDALQERYFLSKRARIELLGQQLEKVKAELEKRDLTKVKTERLFDIFLKLNDNLQYEAQTILFCKEKRIDAPGFDDFTTLETWEA